MRQDFRSADVTQRIAATYIHMYANGRLFSWDERKSAATWPEGGSDSVRWTAEGPWSAVLMKRKSKQEQPSRGRADLKRLRRMPDSEVHDSSPPELFGLPDDFWDTAVLVEPVRKQAISLRVDEDVLTWFKECGPRYQSRMNAVLRSYMHSPVAGAGSSLSLRSSVANAILEHAAAPNGPPRMLNGRAPTSVAALLINHVKRYLDTVERPDTL